MNKITGFGNLKELVQIDTPETCILKLMSDGVSRSISTMIIELEEENAAIDMTSVHTVLNILVAKGKVVKVFMREGPELYTIEGENEMSQKERLDNWLFDTMSDYAKYTINVLADKAVEAGFVRQTVKDRIALLSKKDWFDRSNNGGKGLTYRLKKNLKRPTPLVTTNATITELQSLGEQMNIPKIVVFEKSPPSKAVKTSFRVIDSLTITRGTSNLGLNNDTRALLEEEIAAAKHYAIDAFTDTKAMMLWKVMADYKPYTASEVAIMLEYYHNFGKSTVSVMISQLNKRGWFTKENRTYTLRREIPMPDKSFTIAYNVAKPNTEETIIPLVEPKNADVSAPFETVIIVPTVEGSNASTNRVIHDETNTSELITVNLKGVVFTLNELEVLIKQIKQVKDTFTQFSKDNLLQIERVITVKGVKFTEINIISLYAKVMSFCANIEPPDSI